MKKQEILKSIEDDLYPISDKDGIVKSDKWGILQFLKEHLE